MSSQPPPPPEGWLAVNSMLFLCPALITRGVGVGGLGFYGTFFCVMGGVLVRVPLMFIVAVKSIVKLSISPMPCLFPSFLLLLLLLPGFRRKGLLEAERGVAVVRAPGRRAEVPAADPGNAETSRSRLHRKIGWMMCKRLPFLAVSLPMTWRSFLCWDDAHEIARNFRRSPFCTPVLP